MINDFQLIDGVLTVAEGVSYLKSQQFAQNPDILEVHIPQSVRFFEDEVFAECENLKKVILPDGLSTLGVASFASCVCLHSINIPSALRGIDDGEFLFCEALHEAVLPEGLQYINQLAFQGSGLERVTIPASVREIGEEAFFECPQLRRVDVLGADTVICTNAFGSDYALLEGYIAPGFPAEKSGPAELLYSLLWASCPERHGKAVSERAESFIRSNEGLIMERILKYSNIPAMTGIAARRLLSPESIDGYVKISLEAGTTEITALLLAAKGSARISEGEFDL